MNGLKLFLIFVMMGSFLGSEVFGSHDPDLLKTADISRIMHQILDAHVAKKEVTQQVLRNALSMYINQFDTDHIYLLESEAAEFQNLTATQLNQAIDEYRKNDFTIFKRLNRVIQSAIERERKIRTALLYKNGTFAFPSFSGMLVQTSSPFAQTEGELQQRIIENIQRYMEQQKKRYGDVLTTQKKEQILRSYEVQKKDFENQYLYRKENGEMLPDYEQENLFALHVLKALAKSLDAHTSFYGANEAYDIRVKLQKELQGFGLVLKETVQGPAVADLLVGGSAARSGLIQKDDVILMIDNESIEDEPFEKVMEKLHQNENPTTRITFKRKPEKDGVETTYEVELKREKIILDQDRVEVSSIPFANGVIGIITLHSFYQGDGVSSEKDVRQAIQKLEEKAILRGLILDLRENTGGFLSQAIKVAGLFITDGIIVISKYADGATKYYRDVDSRSVYDGPLLILTSKMTASAAEIVAQALQDYGVALVAGDEHTYGKGTIQTQTVTDNQSTSYFKVTVGKYYTVSGNTPEKRGVRSDILIPGPWNKQNIGEALLGTEEATSIVPAFEDNLEDVSPESRNWYLKYYIPHLQHRTMKWKNLLSILKKNNDYRISHNKNYQYFLTGKIPRESHESEEDELLTKNKTAGEGDLQLQEAENVMRDMILLHSLE